MGSNFHIIVFSSTDKAFTTGKILKVKIWTCEDHKLLWKAEILWKFQQKFEIFDNLSSFETKNPGFEMTLISKIFKNHNSHNFHIALTIYYIHHVCYDFWCSYLITSVHEYDDFYAVVRGSLRSVGLIYVLIIAFSIV